jgi:hypothetical protein
LRRAPSGFLSALADDRVVKTPWVRSFAVIVTILVLELHGMRLIRLCLVLYQPAAVPGQNVFSA